MVHFAETSSSSLDTLAPAWVEVASPAHSLSMTGKMARPTEILRRIADGVAGSLTGPQIQDISWWFYPRAQNLGQSSTGESDSPRIAWLLVGVWLVGFSLGEIHPTDSLNAALDWFLPTQGVGNVLQPTKMSAIADLLDPTCCGALLPYLLDPVAPGTRRNVLRSSEELDDRHKRKNGGVFYTPGDVAHFMTTNLETPQTDGSLSVLDPAAGSGVFLRSAYCSFSSASNMAPYGLDINPLAADFCSLVLLASAGWNEWPSPWSAWQNFRLNQATVDSLSIQGLSADETQLSARRNAIQRAELRIELQSASVPPPMCTSSDITSLSDVFPELASGVDVVLCNPPYARYLPTVRRESANSSAFKSPKVSSDIGSNTYPLFIQKSWSFLREAGSMAFVVPLSLTFGTTSQIRRLREAMTGWTADLKFASFDRTPDALFGDDVKTRNTIVFVRRGSRRAVSTTGLLRWTSRTRNQLFQNISYTSIDTDFADFVPKVNSITEYDFYKSVRSGHHQLSEWIAPVDKAAKTTREVDDLYPLFFAPTAYNWINVLPNLDVLGPLGHTSNSRFQKMLFASKSRQYAAYAILTSRLAYLLWKIEGDGFHLTRRFAQGLPVPTDDGMILRLAVVGEQLWTESLTAPIVSRNGGKTSISIPASSSKYLDEIDVLLREAFSHSDLLDLREWHENNVVVDMSDQRRRSSIRMRS